MQILFGSGGLWEAAGEADLLKLAARPPSQLTWTLTVRPSDPTQLAEYKQLRPSQSEQSTAESLLKNKAKSTFPCPLSLSLGFLHQLPSQRFKQVVAYICSIGWITFLQNLSWFLTQISELKIRRPVWLTRLKHTLQLRFLLLWFFTEAHRTSSIVRSPCGVIVVFSGCVTLKWRNALTLPCSNTCLYHITDEYLPNILHRARGDPWPCYHSLWRCSVSTWFSISRRLKFLHCRWSRGSCSCPQCVFL